MDARYEEIYRAVGQAILDFAPLEFAIHRVAWIGIDPRNEEVGRNRTERLQVSAVLRAIERCAAAGDYERFVPGIDHRIQGFVLGCRAVSERRGRLAHSYLDNGRVGRIRDAIAQPGVPLLGLTESLDVQEVLALPDEYFRLRDDGVAIWLSVEGAALQSPETDSEPAVGG